MKRLVFGILAHVDAGKTTLSEGLLYTCGALRKLGRVDHGDAFLDTETLERERGITIFSKQALLSFGEVEATLLDTPGHVDFCAEMERTLQVLDYAILVISGTDGVQSHTRTLWRLLARYNVPTFLFVNKMDLAGTDKESVLAALQKLGNCVDFANRNDEELSLCDEAALEEFLERGALSDNTLTRLIAERKLFPCFFGSALKLDGVEEFLAALDRYTRAPQYGEEFAARVFKISRDAQGARLSHLKILGGRAKAKTLVSHGDSEEKVDQLRLYSGVKFKAIDTAEAGSIVAVTGLEKSFPGEGLGAAERGERAILESVLTYRLLLPEGADAHTVLPKLKQLEDEDPQLAFLWEEKTQELHVRLMGQIQLEILQRVILDRFGLEVRFGTGRVVYRETIENTVEGVGHFEPLRHYAEVRLLLEPLPRGSGVQFASACPTDALDLNWQRLIYTHIFEREHPGVLTGSALTDVRITLLAGRAHLKHTEGGDFRQSTYRAIRQGLMEAKSVLLEPYYDFRMELPVECVGRAMSDVQMMGGSAEPGESENDLSLLTGFAPVESMRNYYAELAAYTRGRGRLSCTLRGFEPCREQEKIVAEIGYDPERDTENPTGSVFCDHGAGDYVPWNEVKAMAHTESPLRTQKEDAPAPSTPRASRAYGGTAEEDKELLRIFESTYGKVERLAFEEKKSPARSSIDSIKYNAHSLKTGPEYLLVDGYNIIFAWDDLRALAEADIAAAREALIDIMADYRAFHGCELILVFDAYKVKGNPGSVTKKNGVHVIFTKEAQTADAYIERATYELQRNHRVRVATSDNLEQVIILGHGALRVSARLFREEVDEARCQISELIARQNLKNLDVNRVKNRVNIQTKE